MNGNKKGGFFTSLKKKLSSLFWLDNCAGGICLRERKGVTEILCVMGKKGGIMLPKGRVKDGESIEQGALREFQEETGLHGSQLAEKIGIIRDRLRRKKITFYRVQPGGGNHTALHDEAIMWIELTKAVKKMKHASERKFIEKYVV